MFLDAVQEPATRNGDRPLVDFLGARRPKREVCGGVFCRRAMLSLFGRSQTVRDRTPKNGVDSRARFAEVTGFRVSMDAREPVLFKNVGIISIQYELSRPDIRFHETNQRARQRRIPENIGVVPEAAQLADEGTGGE